MEAGENFVHRQGAGQVSVGLSAAAALIVSAFVSQVILGRPAGPEPVVAFVIVAALAHFGMAAERRVVLDEGGLRYTESPVRFGVLRPATVRWEVPAAQLARVREVTTRVPSSRGGWNQGTRLHLTDTQVLDADLLGGKGVADSAYERLAASLRRRLGDRFVEEQVT